MFNSRDLVFKATAFNREGEPVSFSTGYDNIYEVTDTEMHPGTEVGEEEMYVTIWDYPNWRETWDVHHTHIKKIEWWREVLIAIFGIERLKRKQ